MRRVFLVLAALFLPAVALAQPRVVGERPDCVSARAQAVYGAGYTHWVHLENRCGRSVTCRVHTDVSPEVITVELAAGATRDVSTFIGSPAYAFVATVDCE